MHVDHYKDPRTWVPAFVVTTVLFGALKFYRVYLRRIPSIEYIHPDKYRRRTLFGKVTSVGDGDGFHFFHTPGGRWAGWGWLRTVPTEKKALKGNTVCGVFPVALWLPTCGGCETDELADVFRCPFVLPE